MDTDLVERTQRGDKLAYGLLAGAIADRFLALAGKRAVDERAEPGRFLVPS